MYSIQLEKDSIVEGVELIDINLLNPHEEVIESRKNTLKEYIQSYNDYVVIPSIICCSKSFLIIDGHHRYRTLLELGAKKIPVTKVDYFHRSIRTHSDINLALSKNKILEAGEGVNLRPKSTIHEIRTKDGIWKPIILISSLCEFRF